MVAVLQGRGKWAVALVAVLLGCLATPARADEFQYLPDGCDLVFSVNVVAALKSKTSEVLWGMFMKGDEFKQLEKIYKDQGKELTAESVVNSMSMVPVANLARYTVAVKAQDNFKASKAQVAQVQTTVLTQAAQAYAIKNNGVFPPTLAELLRKTDQGGPYLESKEALLDPWKQPYRYDAAGPKNKGARPDIWTVTPDKVVIGNWPAARLNVKDDTGAFVIIYTAIKPVTAADVKAASPLAAVLSYTEVKVGAHTMYEDLGKTGFCVVEGKYVLYGQTKVLRAILERTKKADLAPGLQAALKQVGAASTVSAAISMQALPAAEKEDLLKKIGGAPGALDSALAVTLQASEADGSIKASATLVCKDAAGAAQAKKAVDAGLTAAKGKMEDILKIQAKNLKPDELQMLRDARGLLDAVKVSAKGAQVSAEASVAPASVARALWALFAVSTKAEVKEVPGKSSTDSK